MSDGNGRGKLDGDDELRPSAEEQAWLDQQFPLGDGTLDADALVTCPYCGEQIEIVLDQGGGGTQEYVEDCEVCCRPWMVRVHYEADGHAWVRVDPLVE